ncbi:hypothetical protein L7F22_063897, partial [Adiantum nelumboides]|nr:hypothetical protein [Adiantum nelumboides]
SLGRRESWSREWECYWRKPRDGGLSDKCNQAACSAVVPWGCRKDERRSRRLLKGNGG